MSDVIDQAHAIIAEHLGIDSDEAYPTYGPLDTLGIDITLVAADIATAIGVILPADMVARCRTPFDLAVLAAVCFEDANAVPPVPPAED